jgi:transposase-like protein
VIYLAGISKEVKEEILSKIKAGAKVVDISKDYGVSTKTIYYWLRGKTDSGASVMEVRRLRKENEELKAIVGALTMDLTKLKKREISSRG